MENLLVFNDRDQLQCISSNTGGAMNFRDADFREEINNASLFEVKFDSLHEDSEFIVEGNQIAFKDKDDNFRLFKITIIEKIITGSESYIRAICSDVVLELDLLFEERLLFDNQQIGSALSTVLTRSRWNTGQTMQLGTQTFNLFNISALQAIGVLLDRYEAEFRVRIEVSGNQITGRFIDIISRGVDTGLVLNVGHNVESLNMTVETDHIRTAMKPLGQSLTIGEDERVPDGYVRRLNIQGVAANQSDHGFVKDSSAVFVEDHEARLTYGIPRDNNRQHLEGVVEFSQEEDQEQLMIKGHKYLQTINKPHYFIEIDVIDLAEMAQGDYDHMKLRLGDVVRLVDRERFAKPIIVESRVISYSYDLTNPDIVHIELGNHRNLYASDDRLDNVESQIGNGSGIWGNPSISDNNISSLPQPVTNLYAHGLLQSISTHWDPQRIGIQFELHASQVQGFTPSNANLIYRGVANGFHHAEGVDMAQQWYYRIRAINVHGNASDFSSEVMAQTGSLQHLEDDLENLNDALDNIHVNVIPDFEDRISSNEDALENLNDVILPGVNDRLDELDADLDNLNDTILPAVNDRLDGLDDDLKEANNSIDRAHTNVGAVREIVDNWSYEDTVEINGGRLRANTITAREIKAGTITAVEIEAGSIVGDRLAMNTITANNIGSDQITARHLTADLISANHISSDSILTNHIKSESIIARHLVANLIEANHISSDSITTNHIQANAITANEIASNIIQTRHLTANSINTRHLMISDFTNIAQVNEFDADSLISGSLWTGHGFNWIYFGNQTQPGWRSLALSRTTNPTFAVGDQFQYRFVGYRTGAVTGVNAHIRAFYTNGTWQNLSSGANIALTNVTTTTHSANITINQAVDTTRTLSHIDFRIEFNANTTGYVMVREVQIFRRNEGRLIVDGTIQANHIAANSIGANHIAAGSITTAHLTAAGISADSITSGAVRSNLISGTEISVGNYRWDATAISTVGNNTDIVFNRGNTQNRVMVVGENNAYLRGRSGELQLMYSNGIRANNFAGSGTNLINIHLQPALRTPLRPGMVIASLDTSFPAGNNEDTHQLWAPMGARGVCIRGQHLNAAGTQVLATTNRWLAVNTENGRLCVHTNDRTIGHPTAVAQPSTTFAPFQAGGIFSGNMFLNNANTLENYVQTLHLGGINNVQLMVRDNNNNTIPNSTFNVARDDNGNPRVHTMMIWNRQGITTGGSSVQTNFNGTVFAASSARKWKLNIEKKSDVKFAENILKLNPTSWHDKGTAEGLAAIMTREANGEDLTEKIANNEIEVPFMERSYGLVAEDVVDAGLGMYATWHAPDENGDREVQGIAYERLWVELIPLVRQQRDQIAELTSRLDQLEKELKVS